MVLVLNTFSLTQGHDPAPYLAAIVRKMFAAGGMNPCFTLCGLQGLQVDSLPQARAARIRDARSFLKFREGDKRLHMEAREKLRYRAWLLALGAERWYD